VPFFFILLYDGGVFEIYVMRCDVKYQHRRIIIQCLIGLLLTCFCALEALQFEEIWCKCCLVVQFILLK
jgi:hypothetical protein